jgi:hypothetical protein
MFTTFQTFDFERTCCRLFQKRVMLTTFQTFDNNLQQVRSESMVWKVVNMTRFWNNLQQVRSKSKVWKVVNMTSVPAAGYSRNASCSLLSNFCLILSVPAAGYSRHALCSLTSKPAGMLKIKDLEIVSMTRFWNNLQQVRSKSKLWKVVNMTRV